MKRSLNTQSLVISRCCCAEDGKETHNARARFPLLVLSTCSVFGSKQKGT